MKASPSFILICNGLMSSDSALSPHEDLFQWQEETNKRKRVWFACADKNPLAWYAAIVGVPPVVLLAMRCGSLPEDTKQCWIASPYCGQLGRDTVRVIPEGSVPWCEKDARWLCDALNPLLVEDGMRLQKIGAALLLACREPMRARPQSFAMIAGKTLPSHHPEGEDGGRLMRLISEIQMSLHGRHADHRVGQAEIHGLWFWGGCAWPAHVPEIMPSVATRNPFLQSVTDGAAANIMITEAERMDALLKPGAPLPQRVVLAGEGHAVLLTRSLLPGWGKAAWMPRSVRNEPELLSVIQSVT